MPSDDIAPKNRPAKNQLATDQLATEQLSTDRLATDQLANDKPPAGLRLPPRPGAGPDIGPLLTTLMRREIAASLARLGLDDAAAPKDIADLRSGLRLWRRLRLDMVRAAFGWCAKGLLVLAAMGLLLAGGLWG